MGKPLQQLIAGLENMGAERQIWDSDKNADQFEKTIDKEAQLADPNDTIVYWLAGHCMLVRRVDPKSDADDWELEEL